MSLHLDEISLPAIKKKTRDNLALIISVAAVLFAGGSLFEAHIARVHTDAAAVEAIRLQKNSVEAQIEATRLDERPYINVVPSNYQFYQNPIPKSSQSTQMFKVQLRLIASGRMPAMEVSLGWNCDEQIPGKRMERISPQLRSGEILYNDNEKIGFSSKRMTAFANLISPGEIPTSFCELSISRERDTDPIIVVIGEVTYRDYFEKWHPTSFCYEGRFPEEIDAQKKRDFRFVPCTDFKPTFQ